MRRRPVPTNAGVVARPRASLALTLLLLVVVAGCGKGAVAVESPDLPPDQAAACDRLVGALPGLLDGMERRKVEPRDAYGAAWGEPPAVLTCGVPEPAGFDEYSSCQITNGVAWFIPDEQITGSPEDIVMTTVGRSVNVEVRLPEEHFPPANAMVDLADAIKNTTDETEPCGL